MVKTGKGNVPIFCLIKTFILVYNKSPISNSAYMKMVSMIYDEKYISDHFEYLGLTSVRAFVEAPRMGEVVGEMLPKRYQDTHW